jgi:hypothetical protein
MTWRSPVGIAPRGVLTWPGAQIYAFLLIYALCSATATSAPRGALLILEGALERSTHILSTDMLFM